MTAFAAVPIRLRRELGSVDIAVARYAGKILNAIDHSGHLRFVAIRALHFDVALFQGKSGFAMLCYTKCSPFEILNGVAFVTIAPFGASGKLASMRIRFVAILAVRKSQRLFEISAEMAGVAGDCGMFSQKRKSSLGMLENGGSIE